MATMTSTTNTAAHRTPARRTTQQQQPQTPVRESIPTIIFSPVLSPLPCLQRDTRMISYDGIDELNSKLQSMYKEDYYNGMRYSLPQCDEKRELKTSCCLRFKRRKSETSSVVVWKEDANDASTVGEQWVSSTDMMKPSPPREGRTAPAEEDKRARRRSRSCPRRRTSLVTRVRKMFRRKHGVELVKPIQ